jgi:putrescine aminotransferase
MYDYISPKGWDESEYFELSAGVSGEILELCCGSGRILLPLARAGHRVVGLDSSEAMLAVLGQNLEALPSFVQARVECICADATNFDLGRRFELILLPFFGLNLIEDRAALLACVAEHLTEDGSFAFDFLNVVDPHAPELSGETVAVVRTVHDEVVHLEYSSRYLEGQCAIVTDTRWWRDGSPHRFEQSSLRVATFEPSDLDRLLEEAGLIVFSERSEVLPGGGFRRTLVRCRKRTGQRYPLWHPYLPRDATDMLTLTSGEGCEVTDVDGRRYLDASGGLWSVQCGLGRTEIIDAVTTQLKRLSYGTLFMGRGNDAALELSRELVSLAASPLDWVYLTGSGSESVELALKLVRLFHVLDGRPEKKGILFLDASYHGTFFGSIGVTSLVALKDAFAPLVPGFCSIPAPVPGRCPSGVAYEEYAARCAQVLENMLEDAGKHVAALILEPILGSAGVVIPPRSYLDRVQRACRAHDVLLVADEVATGFGRTGRWFASEHFSLRPDVMLLAKGVNSGYLPLGAVLFSARIGERLIASNSGIGHGSSHNGNPACCAAALATIELMRREGLVERSDQLGRLFLERLAVLQGTPGLGVIRGLGLMVYAGLVDGSDGPVQPGRVIRVLNAMRRRGVLAYPSVSGLVFMPALVITPQQIETVVACLSATLHEESPE